MSKKWVSILFVLFVSCAFVSCSEKTNQSKDDTSDIPDDSNDTYKYINNGKVKLGTDMTAGGSVFFFAESKSERNLLNYADKGRFMQQSYYGASDGSNWNGEPWVWNPVQGGGYRGEPAKILEYEKDRTSIYVRSRPKHWATGVDIEDARMEEHITLTDYVAHIRYSLYYKGKSEPSTTQEVPAVFVDAALSNLVFYNGKKPWTGDKLTSVVPGWPNEEQISTENWAAYVDKNGWGIGVYTPGTGKMTTYRFGSGVDQGPKGGDCSYFAPIREFAITQGLKFEYDVYMTIGQIEQIRERFAQIRNN